MEPTIYILCLFLFKLYTLFTLINEDDLYSLTSCPRIPITEKAILIIQKKNSNDGT